MCVWILENFWHIQIEDKRFHRPDHMNIGIIFENDDGKVGTIESLN
jgi:hypothetical protein